MFRVGEKVRYWRTRSDGLTWLSSKAMVGRVKGRNRNDYIIEARSGATHVVPGSLTDGMTLRSKT
ncbi:hypothetical protein P5609_019915 [Bacillus licheniformis]|uniref:hypothetical protein n=1 Tax=Bacillus licheniformis TaxID=1402 RepID=UPI00115DC01C|nr:hypothetical protein [Bacillus licheniformis]MED4305617.1 hypothetical protein [Bacillus licheniformis]MED4410990.1 hypothetical protein [Bacillus licheniformis]QDL77728.1 hypothetical protein D9Y32_09925 [Bacillus licheniformis]